MNQPLIPLEEAQRRLGMWFDHCKQMGSDFLARQYARGEGMNIGAIIVLEDDSGVSYAVLAEKHADGSSPTDAELEENALGILTVAMQTIMQTDTVERFSHPITDDPASRQA